MNIKERILISKDSLTENWYKVISFWMYYFWKIYKTEILQNKL